MRIIIQKKERKKKKTAVSGIHTCVVRNYDHHMQTYCTFLPCFTSFFFPFYVARTSILHIHSLSLVMCRYSAFVFSGFFLFFLLFSRVFLFFSFVFIAFMYAYASTSFAVRPYARTRRQEKLYYYFIFIYIYLYVCVAHQNKKKRKNSMLA